MNAYTSVTGYVNPYEASIPLIISGITHHLIGYIHPFGHSLLWLGSYTMTLPRLKMHVV